FLTGARGGCGEGRYEARRREGAGAGELEQMFFHWFLVSYPSGRVMRPCVAFPFVGQAARLVLLAHSSTLERRQSYAPPSSCQLDRGGAEDLKRDGEIRAEGMEPFLARGQATVETQSR